MKRSKIIKIRVTVLEGKILAHRASECGISTAKYLREAGLGKPLNYRLTSDEIETLKALAEVKVNFSRISSLIKNRQDIYAETRIVVGRINTIMDKLR